MAGGREGVGKIELWDMADLPTRAAAERVDEAEAGSEIVGRDDFAAGPRDQPGQDADVHPGFRKCTEPSANTALAPPGWKA